jgi:hypothetical protein
VLLADQLTRKAKRISESLLIPSTYLFSLFLWLGCSLIYLSNVPPEWWVSRDDSVIHISAAKNFSLFGSIGLSAGDRVESISSPLNFFISLIAYFVNPQLKYEIYLNFFLVVSLTAVAFSVNYALLRGLRSINKTFTRTIISNLVLYIVTISSWTTFGWLISGMENVLSVVLLTLLIGAAVGNKFHYFNALISVSLLGVARVELGALLIPLLLLVSIKADISKKRKITLFFLPITFWIFVHLARFWYFGHLLPNTATALGKNLPIYLAFFLALEFAIVFLTLFDSLGSELRKARFITPTILLLLFAGIWRVLNSNFTIIYQAILTISLAAILLLLLVIILNDRLNLQSKLLIVISMIPLNHFLLFGPARLSAFRIVSALVIPIFLIFIIELNTRITNHFKGGTKVLLLLPLAVILPLMISKIDHQRNLCCSISPSDDYINAEAQKIFGNKSGNSPIPIVANPDLGKISFTKGLMNVDLGLIGEPVLANLSRNSSDLVDDYLIDYVAPDIVELHGHWNCVYSTLVNNKRFAKEWTIAWSGYVSVEMSPANSSECPRNGSYTIWQRKIPEKERLISNAIASEPFSVYSQRIKAEISSCSTSNSGCQYLTRSIIRNRGLLLERNELTKAVELLAKSPSYKFDYLKVLQPRKWDKEAVHLLTQMMQSGKNN